MDFAVLLDSSKAQASASEINGLNSCLKTPEIYSKSGLSEMFPDQPKLNKLHKFGDQFLFIAGLSVP